MERLRFIDRSRESFRTAQRVARFVARREVAATVFWAASLPLGVASWAQSVVTGAINEQLVDANLINVDKLIHEEAGQAVSTTRSSLEERRQRSWNSAAGLLGTSIIYMGISKALQRKKDR